MQPHNKIITRQIREIRETKQDSHISVAIQIALIQRANNNFPRIYRSFPLLFVSFFSSLFDISSIKYENRLRETDVSRPRLKGYFARTMKKTRDVTTCSNNLDARRGAG